MYRCPVFTYTVCWFVMLSDKTMLDIKPIIWGPPNIIWGPLMGDPTPSFGTTVLDQWFPDFLIRDPKDKMFAWDPHL